MNAPADTKLPPVLLNDFRAQWRAHGAAMTAAFARVGESGWLVLGEEVAAFERELAAAVGLPFAIGVANGLDALEIALRVQGITDGALVATTPLTAFPTTLAILRAGARPFFVDVDASGLLDLDALEAVLASRQDIRAVMPVHLYGHALDVGRLERIGQKYGVVIVEDSAQAIGASHAGRPVGDASPLSATSFYPTKNLGALGDGGAVFARTEALRSHAASLRDYGQSARYVHDRLGMNSRLDEVQAAILRSTLLPALPAATARRREIAARYREELKTPALVSVPVPAGSESVFHLYPVLVRRDREAVRTALSAAGVQTGVHYPILTCDQGALSAVPGVERASDLRRARAFADTELSLPMHAHLTDDDVSRVVAACNQLV